VLFAPDYAPFDAYPPFVSRKAFPDLNGVSHIIHRVIHREILKIDREYTANWSGTGQFW